MATRTLISVQDYLSTAYSPDCDYVDGQVQERNLGGRDHGKLQKGLTLYLGNREAQWHGTQVSANCLPSFDVPLAELFG